MKVLVIGSGGREHALAKKIFEDPSVTQLHCAPGNPGTASFATNHEVSATDWPGLEEIIRSQNIDLVVVGPEGPLVAGIADRVREAGVACFGPSAKAAQLEGSKAFAKSIMEAANVPTAKHYYCTNQGEARRALEEFGAPYVVKNDGLAAGKGVVVTDSLEAALAHADSCGQVVIEEYLDGPEVSLFVLSDGKNAIPLQPAQDFKRVGEGGTGPNTGGMGAYTPLSWAPDDLVDQVMAEVVQPTLAQLSLVGAEFVGLLYVGLALTSKGPKVVEFNARFGDPETQALMAVLDSPLGQALYAAATGKLAEFGQLNWRNESAVTVVLAALGYPGEPKKGGQITLPTDEPDCWVIHAGTKLDDSGSLISAGGRVLNIVARGANLTQAREKAYRMIESIEYSDGFCRSDIAEIAAEQEK